MATNLDGPTRTTLRLSSEGRTSGTNDAPTWRLARPAIVYSALVTGATIPNSMYSIVAGANTLVTSPGSVAIPPGAYTPTTLAAAAQTALQTLDPTYTVSYSATTLRFTIARPAAFTITWTDASPYREMGFALTTSLPPPVVSTTSSAAVTGSEPAAIILRSTELASGSFPVSVASVDNRDIARVPLQGALGVGASSYEVTTDYERLYYGSFGTTLTEFTVTLWDAATGRQIALNGAPWSLELALWTNEGKVKF